MQNHDETQIRTAVEDKTRLEALADAAILDTPQNEKFDGMTLAICNDLGVPVSLISIVDADRQFFKSQQGMPAHIVQERETPLSHSVCQHVVYQKSTLAITDMREYPMFAKHPALKDLNVVAYLGEPLMHQGQVIGSVCAIDHQPRNWTAEDIRILRAQAEKVRVEWDNGKKPA